MPSSAIHQSSMCLTVSRLSRFEDGGSTVTKCLRVRGVLKKMVRREDIEMSDAPIESGDLMLRSSSVGGPEPHDLIHGSTSARNFLTGYLYRQLTGCARRSIDRLERIEALSSDICLNRIMIGLHVPVTILVAQTDLVASYEERVGSLTQPRPSLGSSKSSSISWRSVD
jgi:hypothetical protein